MNNFDTSSTGLNIKLHTYYDTDLSHIYFEEAFFRIKEGNNTVLVYSEGNYSDFEKEYTFTKSELQAAMIDQLCWTSYSLDDLKKDIKEYTGFSWSKAKKGDLIDYMQATWDRGQWQEFCKKAGFKANFDIVVSRGYCQGDYEEVIVPNKFWECIGVKKPDCVQSNLSTTIDHLLWDCPIYCRFTVNDKEYYIDQELKDCYNWDKSEALEIAQKLIEKDFTQEQQTIIISFLSSALKNELDYQ